MMKTVNYIFAFSVVFAASCGDPAREKHVTSNDSISNSSETRNEISENVASKPPKCFYWDYDVPTGTEEAVDMTEDEAKKIISELPELDGNFFGMELSDGSIVQFMYDGPNETWFLDIPNPVTQESHNADVTLDDIKAIISEVYAGKSADAIKAAYPPN